MNVFVFGSNLRGRHGAGSALAAAMLHGAVEGVGAGPTGNAYAIPTKDRALRRLPLSRIRAHVDDFIEYAKECPQHTFEVVAIGCGLAGYAPIDIAPLFADAAKLGNVKLPREFVDVLKLISEQVAS